jgi:hypothetical protein
LAEAVRFELTEHFCSAVFKTAGLNHSPKLPDFDITYERGSFGYDITTPRLVYAATSRLAACRQDLSHRKLHPFGTPKLPDLNIATAQFPGARMITEMPPIKPWETDGPPDQSLGFPEKMIQTARTRNGDKIKSIISAFIITIGRYSDLYGGRV